MTAPKGYLFCYIGGVYHIEPKKERSYMWLCGNYQRVGVSHFTNTADGRKVCKGCLQEAKRKGLK